METRFLEHLRKSLVELDKAWKQVGLSPAESAQQLDALARDVEELLNRKVSTETALFETYKQEVARLKEDVSLVWQRVGGATGAAPTEAPAADRSVLVRELSWLRAQYERLDTKRATMQAGAEEAMLKCHTVWSELGVRVEPGFEDVGFNLVGRKEAFELKLGALTAERERRVQEVRSAAARASALMHELDVSPSEREFDSAIASCREERLGLSQETLDAIELRRRELDATKQERTEVLTALGKRIQPLWDRLNVPPAERNAFFEKNKGYGERVVLACQAELDRLLALKRESMVAFIGSARADVLAALDETRAAPAKRRALSDVLEEPVNADDLDACEGLLARLEAELDALNAELQDLRPIIAHAKRYFELVKERVEYDLLCRDSARLLDRKRGAASMREEELMRKRVQEGLPKIVAALEAVVPQYEAKHLRAAARLALPDLSAHFADRPDQPLLEVVHSAEAKYAAVVSQRKAERDSKKKGDEGKPVAGAGAGAPPGAAAGKRPPAGAAPPAAQQPRVPLSVAMANN